MHSLYGFLFRAPKAYAKKSSKDVTDWAMGEFNQYLEGYGDENNWYESICCVNYKGEVTALEAPNKFGIYKDSLAKPVNARWAHSVNYSDKLINSLVYFNLWSLRESEDKTYLSMIQDGIDGKVCPDYIKKCKSVLDAPSVTPCEIESAKEMLRWHNEKLEMVKDCLLSCRTAYFSRIMATPYDYSCFDLRSETDQSGESRDVVLWMDIHT